MEQRHASAVPNDYFSPLDSTTQKRRDLLSRKELIHGSCEFIATEDYCLRPPQQPVYLFLIDVSFNAVSSGFTKSIASVIRNTLDQLPGDIRTQVGFITIDSAVHFYNLRVNYYKNSSPPPPLLSRPAADQTINKNPPNEHVAVWGMSIFRAP